MENYKPSDIQQMSAIIQNDIRSTSRLREYFGEGEILLETISGGVVSQTYLIIQKGSNRPLGIVKCPGKVRIHSPKGMEFPVPPNSALRAYNANSIFGNIVDDEQWLPDFRHFSAIGYGVIYLSYIPGYLLSREFADKRFDPEFAQRIGNLMSKLITRSWGRVTPILDEKSDLELKLSELEMKVPPTLMGCEAPEDIRRLMYELIERVYAPLYTIPSPSAKNWINNERNPYAIDLDQATVESSPARSIGEFIADILLCCYGSGEYRQDIKIFFESFWKTILMHLKVLAEVDNLIRDISQWTGFKMLYRGPWSISPYSWVTRENELREDSYRLIREGSFSSIQLLN